MAQHGLLVDNRVIILMCDASLWTSFPAPQLPVMESFADIDCLFSVVLQVYDGGIGKSNRGLVCAIYFVCSLVYS